MLTDNFNPFPVISTERLTLRQLESGDASEMFAIRSDERVMRFLDRPRAEKLEDAAKLVEAMIDLQAKNEGVTWAIMIRGELKMIGTIGFWRMQKEHFRAEIGYQLHPDYQGRGIMQEALSAVLEYGFGELNLHSVEANVNPENATSIKLLERNGFVKEAHFKENYYYNGKFLDSVIYSLLTPHAKKN